MTSSIKHIKDYEDVEMRSLVEQVNRRDTCAFSVVYKMHYNSLYMYITEFFKGNNAEAFDIIQDVFMNIWDSKTIFESMAHIKDYLFLSVRNHSIKKYNSSKVKDKYNTHLLENPDYFISNMVEVEVVSLLHQMIDSAVTEECARVLRMYIEGKNIKEIATELGKKESTIYNQKNRGIEILKKKYSKSDLLPLLLVFLR